MEKKIVPNLDAVEANKLAKIYTSLEEGWVSYVNYHFNFLSYFALFWILLGKGKDREDEMNSSHSFIHSRICSFIQHLLCIMYDTRLWDAERLRWIIHCLSPQKCWVYCKDRHVRVHRQNRLTPSLWSDIVLKGCKVSEIPPFNCLSRILTGSSWERPPNSKWADLV